MIPKRADDEAKRADERRERLSKWVLYAWIIASVAVGVIIVVGRFFDANQRRALLVGAVCLGFLVLHVPSAWGDWKRLSWPKRLADGDLWLALAVLAFVLGWAGFFWYPFAFVSHYLFWGFVAAFVIGWILALGWAGIELMKNPRERILALVYLVVVGGLITARLMEAIRVPWSLVGLVASGGGLAMTGLNDYLGNKERKEATSRRE